ncbi:putative fluoride ion transporter CrcB [Fructobacillus pseudoficulneus]|uniref:Fluoride-specific ion channel FluC n=1 Tax=Fructobacillus pseudoficulneus TaxID=220714 RepID=A0A3F3GZ88_9LACO|nr:CrcB family protein [Fructobacillus pseudoficulneus]GAP03307.1 putative fluoride ion transporter CrcB [Fructobacillus pseudoficulneus]SEH44141.1 CrcB protein [Fructobacillus pseudoficulneus]
METNRRIEALVVFAGGALGGLLRYFCNFLPVIGHWPLTTLFINWLGAFLLAFLGAYLSHKLAQPAYWQSFLGTGIMGGFTTFGTMILQVFSLSKNQPALAALYLFASLFIGMLLVLIGQKFGQIFVNDINNSRKEMTNA